MSGSPAPDPSPIPATGLDPATGGPAPATGTSPAPRTFGERVNAVMKKLVIAIIAVAVVVIAYFILEAFLPRWWAGQIGHRVNGSFSSGIGIGLLLGIVCTFVPIVLIAWAVRLGSWWKRIPAIICAVLGVVVAIPNLLTLAVVVGRGNGSHAGQRIFDVQAPGFRAATLWGAVGGALVAFVLIFFSWRYRKRGRQLKESREQAASVEASPGTHDPTTD